MICRMWIAPNTLHYLKRENTFVRRFGIKLVPEFYDKYNPIPTRKDAEELEEYVAHKLRKERYGVWFN